MAMSAQQIAEKHNAGVSGKTNNSLKQQVQSFVDRLDRLEDDKKAINDDIKAVKEEAKEAGLEPRALVIAVKRKRESAEEKAKRLAIAEAADQYLHALGLLDA
jgi:uncharacterized protein (UPF0335 family)